MAQYIKNKIIMNKGEMNRAIKKLAQEIVEKNKGVKDLVIVGIQTRGVPIGKRIISEILKFDEAKALKEIPFGILDITLYRDDMDSMDSIPQVKDTEIPFDITGKVVVIVDDVVFTGRSVRAALDELIDFGRPKRIELAVLIDRGHRELPIEPNFVGRKYNTTREQLIDVEVAEVDGKDSVILKSKEKEK